MKTFSIISALLVLTFFHSCSRDSDDKSPIDSRVVKYELTGTYPAPVEVTYTNEDGALQLIENITLPWSKEITVKTGVTGVGLGATAETLIPSTSGKTLSGKIIVGGEVKQSASVFATSSGFLSLSPPLVHIF